MQTATIRTIRLPTFLSVNATNPFYVQQYNSGDDDKIDVIQSFGATYKVNRFVELDARYGLNYRTETAKWTYHNQSENINSEYYDVWTSTFLNGASLAPDNTGEIDNWHYTTTFQNFLATAYIKADAQKDLHMNIPLQSNTQISFDYRKNKYTEYDTYGTGLPLAPPINMSSTSVQSVITDFVQPFITYGYLVNEKLDIGDWGGVGGGFRSDYSSAFGGGSKPFTFPHVDGYLSLSSFDFWNSLKQRIPYFKLRAAYGEAGIQPGAFDRYPTIAQGNLGSQLIYTLHTTGQNPDLNVEVSKEFEVGTDFTIALNKGNSWLSSINASFTYWKRTSENVIYAVSIAPSTGSTAS
jgi:hypothetical protein